MAKDFKCDLNCPAVNGVFIDGICCNNCYRTKKQYLSSKNEHIWVEGKGFYDPTIGCKLERENMPAECKAYDCRKDKFYLCRFTYAELVWDSEKWIQVKPITMFVRGVIIAGHINKFFARLKSDVERYCYGE